MSSNKRCHPDHFVGLLCYKCKRTDFGGSARRLASHVRYCNGLPKQSYQKNKKKLLHSDDNFTTSHPNGMSQSPFNMNNRSIVGNMNEVCFSNFDNDFESGNPDESDFNENLSQDHLLLSNIMNCLQYPPSINSTNNWSFKTLQSGCGTAELFCISGPTCTQMWSS